MRALLLVALTTSIALADACASSYGSDEQTEVADSAAEDGSLPSDGADDLPFEDAGPACDRTKPFGEPQPVGGIALASSNMGARLSQNELTIYFHADVGRDAGRMNLFSATRPSRTTAFDPPTLLEVSSPADDSFPTPAGDGLTLIFERTVTSVNTDLYQATRPSVAVNFEGARPLVNSVQTPGFDGQPFLRLDGRALYFVSNRGDDAGRDLDIYRAIKADGAFVAAAAVTEINTPDLEYLPVVTEDELTILWTSTHGSTPERYLRIFTASRARQSDPFANIRPLDEINTSTANYASWISPDGCRLYFASDRAAASVGLYVASRPR